MKKTLLVLTLGLTLFGCAFLQAQKANWEACKADPTCLEQAKGWQNKVETVAVPVASAIPTPGAAAIPKVAGYIALAIAMLVGGSHLKKKENPI